MVKLAFKKSDGSISNKLISWWTKSEFVHVEMIINNKWISSNSDTGGVTIANLRPLKDNWTYIDINIPNYYNTVNNTMNFIYNQKDRKYDWCGLLCSQIFKTTIDTKNRWFCSEIVAEILKKLKEPGIILQDKESNSYSPGDLFKFYKG